MNIEDVKQGELYLKIPVSPWGNKPAHKVRCVVNTGKEVSLIVDDEGTASHGLRIDFNKIECKRYLREI